MDEMKKKQKDLAKTYRTVDHHIIEIDLEKTVECKGENVAQFTDSDQQELRAALRKQTDLLQRKIDKFK